jgi:hypothetical protein
MTKNEALDKIKKLLEESALGGRWSFTAQALALVAEIEADAPPAPPPAPAQRYVELRTDVLEEVMGLLADAQAPRIHYTDEPMAMAREAVAAAQRDACYAADALREALPQYFGERF